MNLDGRVMNIVIVEVKPTRSNRLRDHVLYLEAAGYTPDNFTHSLKIMIALFLCVMICICVVAL